MPAAPALGEAVSLRQIEPRLRAFWSGQADQRASLINLAIWSEAEDALQRLPPVIQAVSREHACRALLISADLDPSLEAESQAWITAHCHLGAHGKAACSEQIAFAFRGRMIGRIRNAVLAHLLSDLPFVLFWEGELSEFFEPNLLRRVDRLVVDSATWADPVASWQRVARDTADAEGMVLHDLAWTRGYLPRLLLAAQAEDPRVLVALDRPLALRIDHAPGQRAAARAFAAWAAVALEAEPFARHSGAPAAWVFERAQAGPLQVTLTEVDSPHPLQAIELACGDAATLQLQREAHRWRAGSRFGGQATPVQLAPVEGDDLAAQLTSQLARGGKNTLFDRCLPLLRQLA